MRTNNKQRKTGQKDWMIKCEKRGEWEGELVVRKKRNACASRSIRDSSPNAFANSSFEKQEKRCNRNEKRREYAWKRTRVLLVGKRSRKKTWVSRLHCKRRFACGCSVEIFFKLFFLCLVFRSSFSFFLSACWEKHQQQAHRQSANLCCFSTTRFLFLYRLGIDQVQH